MRKPALPLVARAPRPRRANGKWGGDGGVLFSIVSYGKTSSFSSLVLGTIFLIMKAVLNIERIGFNALNAHARHERREIGDTSHTNRSKTHLNSRVGLSECPENAVRRYLQKTNSKIDLRNETPITRILLSASPEYFRPGRANKGGEYEMERLTSWETASIEWLKSTFGEDVVHIATHVDEQTPHLHAVIVPTYEKKTKRRSCRQVSHHKHPAFEGYGSFERLHDSYAQAVGHLSIERGDPMPSGLRSARGARTKREWMNARLKALSKQISLLELEARRSLQDQLERVRASISSTEAVGTKGRSALEILAEMREKSRGRGRS